MLLDLIVLRNRSEELLSGTGLRNCTQESVPGTDLSGTVLGNCSQEFILRNCSQTSVSGIIKIPYSCRYDLSRLSRGSIFFFH